MGTQRNKEGGREHNPDSDTLASPAIKRNGAEDWREIGERAKASCKRYHEDLEAIKELIKNFNEKSLERFELARELLRQTVFDRSDIPDLAKDKIAILSPDARQALEAWQKIKADFEDAMNELQLGLARQRYKQLINITTQTPQE
jgi:DNA-binding ferritin-like protein (Dps family)